MARRNECDARLLSTVASVLRPLPAPGSAQVQGAVCQAMFVCLTSVEHHSDSDSR
jgi:hypothetical protein